MKRKSIADIFRQALQAHGAANFSAAEAFCRELLARDSAYPGAWNLLGKIAAASDQLAAVDYLGTAVELSPTTSAFRHDLAKSLLETGENFLAFTHAIEAFKLFPTNSDYCFGLALAIESLGDRGSALSLYEHGLTLAKPTSVLFAEFGGMLMRDQRVDESLTVLSRAIDFKPASADAYYLHAKCCNCHGLFREGLSSAKIAADMVKPEPLVYCELALSMLGLNDLDGALLGIGHALSLDPSCSQALLIKARLDVKLELLRSEIQ
jgi:tetratricopeptide (TPR) repeat protein